MENDRIAIEFFKTTNKNYSELYDILSYTERKLNKLTLSLAELCLLENEIKHFLDMRIELIRKKDDIVEGERDG